MATRPTQPSPIVYLGPSLSRTEARRIYPQAEFRPPIQRHDLYRDRQAGGRVFLLLDGVFHSRRAVPAREILDVLEDGAVVAGASSIGALRAADCSPAGLRGIGTIFRLYRRRILSSDDEVALVFADLADDHSVELGSGLRPFQPLTAALINVRFAARRGLASGRLTPLQAERLVSLAKDLHYSERLWPRLCDQTQIDQALIPWLEEQDLKASDARRALHTVRRWLKREPSLGRNAELSPDRWRLSEQARELGHAPLQGLDLRVLKKDWGRWIRISGQFRAYLPLFLLGRSNPPQNRDRVGAALLAGELDPDPSGDGATGKALRGVLERRIALDSFERDVLGAGSFEELTDFLWAEMSLRGELDGSCLRYIAFADALRQAGAEGLVAEPLHVDLAEAELAFTYGHRSWAELRTHVEGIADWLNQLEEYRDQLALVKKVRDFRFS